MWNYICIMKRCIYNWDKEFYLWLNFEDYVIKLKYLYVGGIIDNKFIYRDYIYNDMI